MAEIFSRHFLVFAVIFRLRLESPAGITNVGACVTLMFIMLLQNHPKTQTNRLRLKVHKYTALIAKWVVLVILSILNINTRGRFKQRMRVNPSIKCPFQLITQSAPLGGPNDSRGGWLPLEAGQEGWAFEEGERGPGSLPGSFWPKPLQQWVAGPHLGVLQSGA